jgi:hypothetical protein
MCRLKCIYTELWTENFIFQSGLAKVYCTVVFCNWYSGGGAGQWLQLGPLGTAATNRPIVPAPGDYDDGDGGMIGKGNRSTRRKPAPLPRCPPKTPHAARTRTGAVAAGIHWLTAWVTARPAVQWNFTNSQFAIIRTVVFFLSLSHCRNRKCVKTFISLHLITSKFTLWLDT